VGAKKGTVKGSVGEKKKEEVRLKSDIGCTAGTTLCGETIGKNVLGLKLN